MAGKNKQPDMPVAKKIFVQSLDQVMHQSMMPYAEYVIMDRSLPRVEDGLKPVQRRILYTMMELGLTPDKPHRKSARIVGDCLGKYHPHGDTSVYDAMVRLAQPFNMSAPLVDGHGNFGSMDGDSAAAMRYTEARMTPLALEMLRDLDKDTVPFSLNFDDTMKEPDMLPSRYPNLLVNGASGIAVALATNIPPHNLGETIDGVVAYYKNPQISLEEMMQYIKGPDFPTGGFCSNGEELEQAYLTGRSKIKVRAKTEIEREKSGKCRIVITELPYQVNKATLLEKIQKLREEKKGYLLGISDIRDESDREGTRAVIELKKDADLEKILQYLYKYSDLEVTFGINMVAIAEGKPQQLSLLQMIHYYAEYQKVIVRRRTRYELEEAEKREHILAGLMIAVQNIDEVIRLIRISKNANEARKRLMEAFDITSVQAQAILDLRLRRLTALELGELKRDYEQVVKLIARLKGILSSEKKLVGVIEKELLEIKEKYAVPRRTQLCRLETAHASELQVKKQAEPCDILFTQTGYIKRISLKGNQKSVQEGGDDTLTQLRCMTDDKLRFFTDHGNVFSVAAEEIAECKLKDRGVNAAALLSGLGKDEQVVSLLVLPEKDCDVLFFTKQGMVKRTAVSEYQKTRGKLLACGLKGTDSVMKAVLLPQNCELILVAKKTNAIRFQTDSIPQQGRTAAGVKAIVLEAGDEVLFADLLHDQKELALFTDRGYAKRLPIEEIEPQKRNGKGQKILTLPKDGANGNELVFVCWIQLQESFILTQFHGTQTTVEAVQIPKETRQGKGTPLVLALFDDVVTRVQRSFVQS